MLGNFSNGLNVTFLWSCLFNQIKVHIISSWKIILMGSIYQGNIQHGDIVGNGKCHWFFKCLFIYFKLVLNINTVHIELYISMTSSSLNVYFYFKFSPYEALCDKCMHSPNTVRVYKSVNICSWRTMLCFWSKIICS